MRVTVQSLGNPRDSSAMKKPIRKAWDDHVNEFIALKAPPGLENVY